MDLCLYHIHKTKIIMRALVYMSIDLHQTTTSSNLHFLIIDHINSAQFQFSSPQSLFLIIFLFSCYLSLGSVIFPNVETQVVMQTTSCLIQFRWLSRMLHILKYYCIISRVCVWKHLRVDFPREDCTPVEQLEPKTSVGIIPKGKRESFALKTSWAWTLIIDIAFFGSIVQTSSVNFLWVLLCNRENHTSNKDLFKTIH